MSTIVHLVRHGEVHNPDRILYGRLPGWHLSVRGRQMAAAVAADLADHDITYVAASPLQRAQETVEPVIGALNAGRTTAPWNWSPTRTSSRRGTGWKGSTSKVRARHCGIPASGPC